MSKAFLLSLFFSFIIASGSVAQNRFFEYASVSYVTNSMKDYVIHLSKSSGLYSEKGKSNDMAFYDHSPVFKFVEKLTMEGWEVYAVYNVGTGYQTVFQLRREIKDKVDLAKVIKNSVEKSMTKE